VAANVGLSAAAPETISGKVGMVMTPALAGLLGDQQSNAGSDLAWTAVMGMLTFGKLPQGAREALTRALGQCWPTVQNAIERVLAQRSNQNRNVTGGPTALKDAIQSEFEAGGLGPIDKLVLKGGTPGQRKVEATIGPHGEIQLDTAGAQRAKRDILRKFKVDTSDELLAKIEAAGGLAAKSAKELLKQKAWSRIFDFDLRRTHEGDLPLRDPDAALAEINASSHERELGIAQQYRASLVQNLNHIHNGLTTHESSPMQGILRGLAGQSRATNAVVEKYHHITASLLKDVEIDPKGESLIRAIEGDQEAYDGLPAEAKLVVDGERLINNALRRESPDGAVPNYFPRIDASPPPGQGRMGALTAAMASRHREEALIPKGDELILGQRFRTIQEANVALAAAQRKLRQDILDPAGKVPKEFQEAQRQIHQLAHTDPDAAEKEARDLAAHFWPLKSTNFFDVAQRTRSRQIRALKTRQALHQLTQTMVKLEKDSARSTAAAVKAKGQRHGEQLMREGYRYSDVPGAKDYLIHTQLAKELEPYVRHLNDSSQGGGWLRRLNQLESSIVAGIMESPLPHAWNMANRMMSMAALSPIHTAAFVAHHGVLNPRNMDTEAEELRYQAWRAGVNPRFKHRFYGSNVQGMMEDAYSDIGDNLQALGQPEGTKSRIGGLLQAPTQLHNAVNDPMWAMYNDFGVMAYHIEREAAIHSPMFSGNVEDAEHYAARRANSWMGAVAPEDTNPVMHQIAKTAFFAPNWWRTYAELVFPMYKKTGMQSHQAMYQAYRSAKTLAAMSATAYTISNLTNFITTSSTPWAMDGHFQFQNKDNPGNPKYIEASGGWLDHIPGMPAAHDAKTGATRTLTDPLARQYGDFIDALGLGKGLNGWTPNAMHTGFDKELAARLSPLLDASSSLLNVDLYRTVSDMQFRATDPTHASPDTPNAQSILEAVMYMTPFGIDYSQAWQQAQRQGNAQQQLDGPFGTKVPAVLVDSLNNAKDSSLGATLSWLTGINAPYQQANKTAGTPISDADYQKVQQYQQQYQQHMSVLSSELLSGQVSPDQWRTDYKALSQQHAAELDALYKGAPSYVDGADGMANSYESLYAQSTLPDGSIDFDHLDQLQAQFRGKYSADQLQGMDALLKKNDSKYPALKLYHDITNSYYEWQSQYAAQNGVDVSQLRQDVSKYNQFYSDPIALRQWRAQNPSAYQRVQSYERAKTRQWARSPQGAMYSLFYGGSRTSAQELQRLQLTNPQLVAELEQQSSGQGFTPVRQTQAAQPAA
jgi:hypothetical protein